jgi:hypothetical protein
MPECIKLDFIRGIIQFTFGYPILALRNDRDGAKNP